MSQPPFPENERNFVYCEWEIFYGVFPKDTFSRDLAARRACATKRSNKTTGRKLHACVKRFRAHLGHGFFFKLTADQILVHDWIGGASMFNLL